MSMIERLYVDNYRTLVNFEWKPQKIDLLIGENGSGKSSIIDAVWGLRNLIAEPTEVRKIFPRQSLTRWDQRTEQTFELDLRLAESLYTYKLVVEHSKEEPQKSRVAYESLRCRGKLLMENKVGELHLFRDSGTAGPVVTTDWSRSALFNIAPGKDNKLLQEFKRWIREDLWFLRPDPRAMSSRTDEECDTLDPSLKNLASWLPQWMAWDFSSAVGAFKALANALDGFQSLQVNRSAPRLESRFGTGNGDSYEVEFSELSDGQRQLCGLYIMLHAVVRPGRTVFFDEPDNYVALREIQPWLIELLDFAQGRNDCQIWIVSHHPEILNQLAPQHGTSFTRDGGPTRIKPFTGAEGLTPAEAMARGWENE